MKRQSAYLFVVAVLALLGPLATKSRGNFTLTDNQQLTVNSSHNRGWLYDISRAFIVPGGSVDYLLAYDSSTVGVSGGSVGELYPWNSSTVNISSGNVSRLDAFDSSTVDISGGNVSYTLFANDSSAVNISGGTFANLGAYNSSTVNVSGGNVYRLGTHDSSTVDVSGGTFTYLNAQNSSTTDISGGTFTYLNAYDFSVVNISGGTFTYLNAQNSSTTDISGGTFANLGAYDSSSVDFSDGNVTSYLFAYNSSTLNVSGGNVYRLYARDSSTVDVSGGTFTYLNAFHSSTVDVSDGNVGTLNARYSSTVDISGGTFTYLYAYDSSAVNISGGAFANLGAYNSSTVNVSGGNVYRLGAHDSSTVDVSGGTFTYLNAYDFSVVNISGGTFATLGACDSSRVNISGGPFTTLDANDASTVDICGGSVDQFNAFGSSVINLQGRNFSAGDGLAFDGERVLGTGVLSGEWLDGTPWVVSISTNQPTATILAVAEFPAPKYSGGTGEPNDPYKIAIAEDLNDIGNHQEDWGKIFILINDVNLAQYTDAQFRIIGNSTRTFTGILDGNDHKVCNFTWSSTDRDAIGLFAFVGPGGQIKNLGMANTSIHAGTGNAVGGLVGYNYGTINNCYSTGSVSGTGWSVGGLVGYNYSYSGTITNCYSTGSVSGTGWSVGGLVGYNDGTITNCYSTGSVTGGNYVGGIVGGNYGSLTVCYATGSVSGYDEIGGLVGYNEGELVGYNEGGTISNCYSSGSVSGEHEVGGLVGTNGYYELYCEWFCDEWGYCWEEDCWEENYPGWIYNCYSTGKVSGGSGVGGLVGVHEAGEVGDSFWDTETSGQSSSAGGEGKTTVQMKDANTFTSAGWDFVNVWDICEGTNYPRLQWQTPVGDLVCPYGVDFLDFAIFAANWYGHSSNSYTIPMGKVVVDGDISEWSENVEWIALDKVYSGSPNDVGEARFALKWDESTNKIYVAVIVEDFNHVFRDDYGTFSASDRLELCSQGDAAGGSYTFLQDIAQQYIIAPDTNNGSWATLGFGEPNIAGTDLEYVVTVVGDLIIYEAGVKQFDNYGGKSGGETIVTDLHVGHVVRFDVVADTRWSDTGFGMLSENNMASKFRIADNIAKYTLVEQSERPPCLELKADLDRNCIVNFKDLALFCDDWLLSQSP